MSTCRVCLGPAISEAAYHPRCLKELFDANKPPTLDIDIAKLHTAALSMVGRTSLSGVQKKISLGLSVDKSTLTVITERNQYILKPQTGIYPSLPENEQLTTCLAKSGRYRDRPGGPPGTDRWHARLHRSAVRPAAKRQEVAPRRLLSTRSATAEGQVPRLGRTVRENRQTVRKRAADRADETVPPTAIRVVDG